MQPRSKPDELMLSGTCNSNWITSSARIGSGFVAVVVAVVGVIVFTSCFFFHPWSLCQLVYFVFFTDVVFSVAELLTFNIFCSSLRFGKFIDCVERFREEEDNNDADNDYLGGMAITWIATT